jgi:hypothetical protein
MWSNVATQNYVESVIAAHVSPSDGLLFATQFSQITLVVMEKAAFEEMRYKGFLQ